MNFDKLTPVDSSIFLHYVAV